MRCTKNENLICLLWLSSISNISFLRFTFTSQIIIQLAYILTAIWGDVSCHKKTMPEASFYLKNVKGKPRNCIGLVQVVWYCYTKNIWTTNKAMSMFFKNLSWTLKLLVNKKEISYGFFWTSFTRKLLLISRFLKVSTYNLAWKVCLKKTITRTHRFK